MSRWAVPAETLPSARVVHEGRGGYVEIEGTRYPIEHVGAGRFTIAFPNGTRGAARDRHQRALEALVEREPDRWAIETRGRRAR